MASLKEKQSWKKLEEDFQNHGNSISIAKMFSEDKNRFSKMRFLFITKVFF